jgi:hypothetical protein
VTLDGTEAVADATESEAYETEGPSDASSELAARDTDVVNAIVSD